MEELFHDTFKAMRRELGHDRPRDERELWQRRLSADCDFCRALVGCGYLTSEQMQRAARRYRLGRSRDGGVIFWQIDQLGQVYDGKIMHYRPDCHRDHQRKPTWVSFLLRRSGHLPEGFTSGHCLFGTHLLGLAPNASPKERGVVAVVESEKTAVILSEHYPDCLWLATGGLYELTPSKLFPLRGRRVILFPDTDPDGAAFSLWYDVAQKARRLLGQDIFVSPLLEQRATPEQKRRKIDIADYFWEERQRTDADSFRTINLSKISHKT